MSTGVGRRETSLERIRDGLHLLQRLLASRQPHASLVAAAGVDVSQQELHVLQLLEDGGARSMVELGRGARLQRAAVTRQVQELEERGLARRRPSPDHGRVVLVEATSAGRRAATRLIALRRLQLADALEEWSDEECDAFAQSLLRFLEDLQTTPHRTRVPGAKR